MCHWRFASGEAGQWWENQVMRDLEAGEVASRVPDLRGMPLEQAAALPPVTLGAIVGRVLPGSSGVTVPFSSSI